MGELDAAVLQQRVGELGEVDGRIFAQATAILEYLEETYPEPALLPAQRAGSFGV